MGNGDQAGNWGSTTNTNLGTLIEQAISGYVTQSVSTGTDTVITIPDGATGVARNMFIELTGSGGASTNLIVPTNKKLYFIYNATSSGQVTVKVTGLTGVSVPNGAKMILVSNGTDIVNATNYIASLTLGSALPVTSGGTGGTTSTGSGAVVLATSPTLVTPALGTPSALVATNVTGTASGLTAGSLEAATITASAPVSSTNYDVSTQTVQYYTSNATVNFTLNIRGNGSTSLNTLMATGQAMTLALLITNGSTAYYPNVIQIDGTTVTPKWQNAITPTAGIANAINIYVFTVIKTASGVYTVLGSQTQFA